MSGEGLKAAGIALGFFKMRDGEIGVALGFVAAFVQSPEAHGGEFVVFGVTAGGFAENSGGLGGIENVIEDLEGESEVPAVFAEGVDLGGAGSGGYSADAAGAGNEAGGFFGVNIEEPRLVGWEIFGGKVFGLSADHTC